MLWPLRAVEESVAPEGLDGAHSVNSPLIAIGERLREHSYEEAVRLFLDAQDKHQISANGHLLDELLDTLGRDLTARLVSAFAHHPCPACRDGTETCAECEGKGIRYDHTACERCIGTGRTRCGFCGGSGLSTLGVVPTSFRYPVLARRVSMLSRRIGPLLQEQLPPGEGPMHDLLLSLNKILHALEDSILASEAMVEHEPHLAEAIDALVQICRKGPQQVQPRIRSILRRLGQFAARESSIRKAEFYSALAESSDFAGTELHHPLLS